MFHDLTPETFDEEVLHTEGLVLLDYWAEWCFPCRMLTPTLKKVAAERPDIKICRINIDEHPSLATRFGIMSIPTLIAYRDGAPIDQLSGAASKKTILSMFK